MTPQRRNGEPYADERRNEDGHRAGTRAMSIGVLALVAAAACCLLPALVAGGVLATVAAWVLHPIFGVLAGLVAFVVVIALMRSRRRCDPTETRPGGADDPAQHGRP